MSTLFIFSPPSPWAWRQNALVAAPLPGLGVTLKVLLMLINSTCSNLFDMMATNQMTWTSNLFYKYLYFFHTVSRLCYLSKGQTYRDESLRIVPWLCFLNIHTFCCQNVLLTLKTLKFKYIPSFHGWTLHFLWLESVKCV